MTSAVDDEPQDGASLPPLSISILGVEPVDEFIKEVADFVHHMIINRPDVNGHVEVEAKVGVLKDKMSGQRLLLPVLVETSMSIAFLLVNACNFWQR
jgi:polynucleotide 5'-triphosphatase